jgi:hypothetical protein
VKNALSQCARINIRKNSFAVRIVDRWNQLPESGRAEEKLPPFKRKLKGLVAWVPYAPDKMQKMEERFRKGE